jgi:four helix bundle protein
MEPQKFLRLNDIEAYKLSFALSNYVWHITSTWNNFEKDTVGKQFVRAADSISANIAEGFGRFGKKDKVRFFRVAQGSMYETLDWNEKSKVRQLMPIADYNHILDVLQKLPKAINSLIKFTNNNLTV